MQSGISASEELQAQFTTLLETPSTFGLLVKIEKESLVPFATLPSAGSSFAENLPALQSHVTTEAALYAILRRYDEAPNFLAVTYVPDAAPVRQKMLFASTRLTLVRELGTEHFRETIFATTPEELSERGFQKHDDHSKIEAPLTEEERTLGEVKRAEQEAGAGTGTREIHLSKNLSMPLSEDALAAIKAVGDGERSVTMLRINADTEIVELVPESPTPSTIDDLAKVISPTEPRFTFFRYVHTHDGKEQSPTLFFFTCPETTTGHKALKYRMMYPLMKRAVISVAEQEVGLALAKKFEVESPGEITEKSILDDLHPKATARAGFSRPKRPGR
ncbi:twinfilin [Geosmithia morbida]|uniref:Twinfilin n=1 Tax=Geosmithia morbida TaxID=1094350 RepID=A0A9P4YMS2_9HYPO|nr:twinfilin [Geosmithia morbida]KAF4119322.1 twinfilin [Geosmithia morbida]